MLFQNLQVRIIHIQHLQRLLDHQALLLKLWRMMVMTMLIRMMTLMWVLRRMIHRKVMILHRHLSLLNPPHLFIGW